MNHTMTSLAANNHCRIIGFLSGRLCLIVSSVVITWMLVTSFSTSMDVTSNIRRIFANISKPFNRLTSPSGHENQVFKLDIINGPLRNQFDADPDDKFECVSASFKTATFPICLYDSQDDIHISRVVRQTHTMFELGDLTRFLGLMTSDMGLIDVGANLGTYTLPAAHLGYQVVAVEMTPRTAIRLRKSVILGKVEDKVKLINAAASNVYREYYIGYDKQNRGDSYYITKEECKAMAKSGNNLIKCDQSVQIPTILLDDLVNIINFKTGAMKIDAQGAELYVFQNASKLFDAVDIKFVLIEWVLFGDDLKRIKATTKMSKQELLIHNMVDFFLSRDYKPYSPHLKDLTNTPRKDWSYNVIFKRD